MQKITFSHLEQVLFTTKCAEVCLKQGQAELTLVVLQRQTNDFVLLTRFHGFRQQPEEYAYQGDWQALCAKLEELNTSASDPCWHAAQ